MTLRPSSVPFRVPLPAHPASSLPTVPDLESDRTRTASPTVSRLLATVVTDPSFESSLVAELLDFAVAYRLDYTTALVVKSASASPPSVGGECALDTDVLDDTQEDFECLAAAVRRFASMLLALEGDPNAPDIPTPRSYAEAITGPYSSQWQAAMDAEMASWKSTGTYVDEVPPPGANIVDGMWIFRVKRPPGSPPAFRYSVEPASLRSPPGASRVARHIEDYTCGTSAARFAPATADPSLCLRTDTSLPPFYDLVFATADTEALTLVKSTSGMGLVLGGRGPVVLTGHADASWELRWLTYLRSDLGEQPRSPPVLYIDNKAMFALCQEHRLEHRTKHIALQYFLARDLQQRGQLRLAYVATRANTADIFTKALPPSDHQRFPNVLGLVPTLPHLLTA
ncbi:unnamed protein product [Closterium sp. NIES-54]